MDRIEEFLRTQLGVKNENLCSKIKKNAHIRSIKKGEYLVKSGENITELCFLLKGLFRFFFLDGNGREVTDCFCYLYGCPAVPAANINDPWPINIVAVEDSQVLAIPIDSLQRMLQNNTELLHIYNRLLISAITEHYTVKMALYQYSAAERYEWFLRRYEGMIDRVPHVYIASFLGMSPVTLSRLRGKRRNGFEKAFCRKEDGSNI